MTAPVAADAQDNWWGADRATLVRVMADQLHGELCRLRLGDPDTAPPWLWTDDTDMARSAGLAIDSLDRMALAAAAAELIPGCSLGPGLMSAASFGAWCDAARDATRPPPTSITFRSSGTTGARRSITHRLARLDAEASALAMLIGSGRRRVLSAIPAHHIYGFIHSVLLPSQLGRAGGALLPVVELRGHAPSELAGLLRPGDLVLGHPAFWTQSLRGAAGGFPEDVVGITSSAPCPEALAEALREAGLARLLQIYGASETGGIGWRDAPGAPYVLLPGWQRDADGLSWAGQPVEPPDRLAWESQDGFRVLGRHDGMVQVGGVNVDPAAVRLALLEHPAVSEIAVRLMRPEEGARLKAFVVPRQAGGEVAGLRAELRQFAATRLAPGERPGAYSFGTALPRNLLGKLSDWVVDEPGGLLP
ncbi:AMP-binding enzyme [Lichenicola sp.]|uniref:AMP-binding enzyme n=1 Tax=Lichenicola sp. TaxID=2804529 RepID=UPI003B002032